MQTQIAHFKILEEIGRGGMGVVYKAQDVRLQRLVAIKILHDHLGSDQKNLQRFIVEARAASALNHPNICTIYEADQIDGLYYIAMEYIDGETVRQILNRRGALPESEVLEIGSKVGDALSTAHAKGIIHRDIKPENIMISREGYVKVMDFGLAKLKYDEAESLSSVPPPDASTLTRSYLSTLSSLLGTASYMSPEQIERKPVDGRSDIFSLGIMLYELAVGKLPFRGETTVEIMESILYNTPTIPPDSKNRLPENLNRAILTALKKEPDLRFQNASTFVIAIKSGLVSPTVSRLRKTKTVVGLAAIFMIVLSILGLFFSKIFRSQTDKIITRPFENAVTVPVTNWPGMEDEPAFSPNGEQIAFTSDQAGNLDIWVQSLMSGDAMNITSDCLLKDESPRWSLDGRKIVFISERESGGIFMHDLTLNQVIKITNSGKHPTWSTDGSQIAFVSNDERAIQTYSLIDRKCITIFQSNDEKFCHRPVWSPDGNWLLFAIGTNFSWNICIHSVADDRMFYGTQDSYLNHYPIWYYDGKGFFFRSDRGGLSDIWFRKLSLEKMMPIGDPIPVTIGTEAVALDVSRNGQKIVCSKVEQRGNIYALKLSGRDKGSIREVTAWNRKTQDPAISPDGKRIALTSNIQGNYDLWLCDLDGNNAMRFHRARDSNETPVWSPDGKRILFVDGDAAQQELKILNLKDLKEIKLTNNDCPDLLPDWSPDGKYIAFTRKNLDDEIWIMPASGGAPKRLTFDPALDAAPRFSPDGKIIAFSSTRNGYWNVWTITIDGGTPKQITYDKEIGGTAICWSSDGKYIYYCPMHNGVRNIWKTAIAGSYREQLTFFTSPTKHISRMSYISTDNKELFFSLAVRIGDIWLMTKR